MDAKKRKKIHIDLAETIHQKLRVKAALEDVSIQKFVAGLISDAVKDIILERIKKEKKNRSRS